MALSTAQKLKIKENHTLLTINAPEDFTTVLKPLPLNVSITSNATNYQQLHWFVKDKAQLKAELPEVIKRISEKVSCWIYFPKGTSKIQTDLNRDNLYAELKGYENMQFITLVSFNSTWSAFGWRPKNKTDKQKEVTPKERPIFNYIDPEKKTVTLPEDFKTELNQHESEKAFYETLSFTNKKEYVEWIVSAKKEETRNNRIQEAIDRLSKKWKNPANR